MKHICTEWMAVCLVSDWMDDGWLYLHDGMRTEASGSDEWEDDVERREMIEACLHSCMRRRI